MELTQEQKSKVNGWAAEGAGLSEIQNKIFEEFGIKLSFIETRLLLLDLGTKIKDKEEPKEKKEDAEREKSVDEFEDELNKADGGVSVSISPLARPGFAMTGEVVFSDGVKGEWAITADGRLALDPEQKGYRPSEEDLRAFQVELRNIISKQGY